MKILLTMFWTICYVHATGLYQHIIFYETYHFDENIKNHNIMIPVICIKSELYLMHLCNQYTVALHH